MIKAIVFDCFGVLTTDGWLPFVAKFFSESTSKSELAHELNKKKDTGLISYGDFINKIADLAGVGQNEVAAAINNNQPNTQLFEFIKQLKLRYRIGVLSNAGSNVLNELFSPEQNNLFDVVCLSYQNALVKPDPEAYKNIAAKLNLQTNEIVFIDDMPRYVNAALLLGMQGIVYSDFASFKGQLEALLTDSNS